MFDIHDWLSRDNGYAALLCWNWGLLLGDTDHETGARASVCVSIVCVSCEGGRERDK